MCILLISPLSIISCSKLIEAQLDNTLDLLLSRTLGLNYKIIEAKYSDLYGFDPGASYWVALGDHSKNKTISILDNNNVPWPEEIAVTKKYIQKKFAFQESLEGYNLYELEVALIGSSLCKRENACNYFIFRKIGEKNLFIDIVKS